MTDVICPKCSHPVQAGDKACLFCHYIFTSSDILPVGAILRSRYEIQEFLRSGGMGYIYLVKDKDLFDRLCILKRVKEPIQVEEQRKKLAEEALRMSSLDHPNIAMIFDQFIESGYYYLVVELIHGKTLSEVFKECPGRLSEDEVIRWAIVICDIVAFIHSEGILHRDISPDNIMLNENGTIKFIDFGTLAGEGKLGYTPPEQWQGKPEARSDIFAIGATIYYLLTGFLPLSVSYKTGKAAQREDFYPQFPPIRQKNPGVSFGLEAILEKALQLDTHARYGSAGEMQRALEILEPKTIRVSDSVEPNLSSKRLAASIAIQYPTTLLPLAVCLLAVIYFSLLSPIFGGGWIPIPIIAVSGIMAISSFFYHYKNKYSVEVRGLQIKRGSKISDGAP